jgi:hypothetical protein
MALQPVSAFQFLAGTVDWQMRNVHPGLLSEGRMHSQTKEIRDAVIDDLSLTAACAGLTGCPQHHE